MISNKKSLLFVSGYNQSSKSLAIDIGQKIWFIIIRAMKKTYLRKNMALALACVFFLNTALSYSFAQTTSLNQKLQTLAVKYEPINLVGIKTNPDDPFKLEFLINQGTQKHNENSLKEESLKLARYFMAGLATPSHDLWVNLQPGQSNRIIPNRFATTEMGEDMLAQDYTLKRLAASLTDPRSETGKKYWDKINSVGTNNYSPATQTFNRIWIIPESATIYEDGTKAYLTHAKLKVMCEDDYFAMDSSLRASAATKQSQLEIATPHNSSARNDAANPFKTLILPLIEKEVNTGMRFAQLRQIYHAMLLAAWYKNRLKTSPLYQTYANKNKTVGIDFTQDGQAQETYGEYMNNFKNGEYNFIQRERVGTRFIASAEKITRRQYFSGGVSGRNIEQVTETAMHPSIEMPPVDKLPPQALPQVHLTVLNAPPPNLDLSPQPTVPLTTSQMKIRKILWGMENLRYKDLSEKKRISASAPELSIQSNAKIQLEPCNGHCEYCYEKARALAKIRESAKPMSPAETRAAVINAIAAGVTLIDLPGNDTLQDMDSFWAIVDACKGKPISFRMVTNGIYFMKNDPKKFFQELTARLGKVKSLDVVLSWDPDKVQKYSRRPELAGINIVSQMRETVRAYFDVVQGWRSASLGIFAHEANTTNNSYRTKQINDFYKLITFGIPDTKERLILTINPASPLSPQVLEIFARTGRIYETIEAGERASHHMTQGHCNLDLSTGEMYYGQSNILYQRRRVTPQNITTIMTKVFQTPCARILYNILNQKTPHGRFDDLFAAAKTLKPETKSVDTSNNEQMDRYIKGDEELMAKLELVFLLAHMIETAQANNTQRILATLSPGKYNHLEKIPRELIEAAMEPDVINALIAYVNERKPQNAAGELVSPAPNVAAVTEKIRGIIIPGLEKRGIITEAIPLMPKEFAEKIFITPESQRGPKKMGIDPLARIAQSLGADTPRERRYALNILGLFANDATTLPAPMYTAMDKNIDPKRFTETEQMELIHILYYWMALLQDPYPIVITTGEKYSTSMANNLAIINLLAHFLEGTSETVRLTAAEMIVNSLDKIKPKYRAELLKKAHAAQEATEKNDNGGRNPASPTIPSAPSAAENPAQGASSTTTKGGVDLNIDDSVVKTSGKFEAQNQNNRAYDNSIPGLTVQFVDFKKI